MHAIVHAADVQDRDGGALVMASLFGAFPFLIKLYADGGYPGPEFESAMKRILAHVTVEIVKRSDQATGFIALPKRWIVERTRRRNSPQKHFDDRAVIVVNPLTEQQFGFRHLLKWYSWPYGVKGPFASEATIEMIAERPYGTFAK